jgi:hypothetical protein
MPVGAPKGNTNGKKGQMFADAVRVALMTYEATDVPQGQALRKIAEVLVKGALEGNMTALQEIANRLDGKPNVSVDVSQTVEIIRRAADLNDDELASIAAGGRAGTATTQSSAEQPASVH